MTSLPESYIMRMKSRVGRLLSWILLSLLLSSRTFAFVRPSRVVNVLSVSPRVASSSRSSPQPWSKKKTTTVLQNFREDALSQELDATEMEFLGHSTDDGTARVTNATVVSTTLSTSSSFLDYRPQQQQQQQQQQRPMKTTDAASIIAGTAIGGGFLALPSFTSPIGWLPTALGLVLAYGFLVTAAIAFVEAAGLVHETRQQQQQGTTITTTTNRNDSSKISVASVIRQAFGKRWAVVGGMGFVAQMLAVMTAQVVKGGEMMMSYFGVPYVVACTVPVAIIGLFCFTARPEAVERVNTALTAVMVGGFVALIFGALARANAAAAPAASLLLAKAEWLRLLPNTKVPFAMPIFIKLLAFGEAMPLLVERMVLVNSPQQPPQQTQSPSSIPIENDNDSNSATTENEVNKMNSTNSQLSVESTSNDNRARSFRRVRTATVWGALVPLFLAIIWSGISAALVEPSCPNPLLFLLNYGPSISIPVLLLAYGAIGTTLMAAFLAMSHFCSEMVCAKVGYCSPRWMRVTNFLTVAVPCTLACLGPSLYLPLLAFAGAYPTTLLYGLAPALAALTLRRRLTKTTTISTPRLVPGGPRTLVALTVTALGLVGASTVLAGWHLLKLCFA